MQILPLPDIPLIHPGDDLAKITLESLKRSGLKLLDGDILVYAQKVISKAENRFVNLNEVKSSKEAEKLADKTGKDARLVEMVLRESKKVIRAVEGILIVEHRCGFICANAGIDHSNVKGPWGDPENWILLLPEDPDRSARNLRQSLQEYSGAEIGVLIIDSHGRAWRMGTVGVTIGIAGMPGLVDLRENEDLFGYRLRYTQVAAADELAAAASLVMGQVSEGIPIVHVRGFPYPLRDSNLDELIRPEENDLFR